MPLVYPLVIRNGRLQVVLSAIDAGAGPGLIQLGTAGMAVVLSTVVLLKPAGIIVGGVLTFSGTPLFDVGAAASGLATAARITDSAGTIVASGLTVGLAGSLANIIISAQNIVAGIPVEFVAGTITGN